MLVYISGSAGGGGGGGVDVACMTVGFLSLPLDNGVELGYNFGIDSSDNAIVFNAKLRSVDSDSIGAHRQSI